MEKGEQFNFITLQDIVLTINQKYKSKVKEHFKSLPLQEQVVTAGLVMFFSYTKSNQKATIANLLPIVNREMLQKTSNKISRMNRQFQRDHGREPSAEEVAAALGISGPTSAAGPSLPCITGAKMPRALGRFASSISARSGGTRRASRPGCATCCVRRPT